MYYAHRAVYLLFNLFNYFQKSAFCSLKQAKEMRERTHEETSQLYFQIQIRSSMPVFANRTTKLWISRAASAPQSFPALSTLSIDKWRETCGRNFLLPVWHGVEFPPKKYGRRVTVWMQLPYITGAE